MWVGFVAAMLMAVYPYVWLSDVMVLSETIAMTANLAVALLCYKLIEDHRWRWAVGLGVAAGAAALVRAEMVLLGPLLIVPLVLLRSCATSSCVERIGRIAVAGLAMVAVLTPWLYRNMTVYDNPVTMSTGTGITLANTNCDDTYYDSIGYWSFRCIPPLPVDPSRRRAAGHRPGDVGPVGQPERPRRARGRHRRAADRHPAGPRPDGRPVRRRGVPAGRRARLHDRSPRAVAGGHGRPVRAHVGPVRAVAAAVAGER